MMMVVVCVCVCFFGGGGEAQEYGDAGHCLIAASVHGHCVVLVWSLMGICVWIRFVYMCTMPGVSAHRAWAVLDGGVGDRRGVIRRM